MGKGDRRSRKGKVWSHSYGVTRKRKKKKGAAFVPKVKKEKKAPQAKIEATKVPQEVMAEAATPVAEVAAAKPKKAPAKKKAAEPKADAPAKKKAAPKKKA